MAEFTFCTADNAPEAARGGLRPIGVLAMITHTCLLSLSSALFIGVAAAQTPSGPIVGGRQLQPTQQQVDSKENTRARQWNRGARSEIDRLYDELLPPSSPPRR